MNTNSQKQTVLELLRQYPYGVNRAWITEKFFIMDVPTRIFEFKEDGFKIGKKIEKNKTATYFLISEPKQVPKPIVEIPKPNLILI